MADKNGQFDATERPEQRQNEQDVPKKNPAQQGQGDDDETQDDLRRVS